MTRFVFERLLFLLLPSQYPLDLGGGGHLSSSQPAYELGAATDWAGIFDADLVMIFLLCRLCSSTEQWIEEDVSSERSYVDLLRFSQEQDKVQPQKNVLMAR